MRTSSRNPFTTVTTAGLLLPVDLLIRIVEGDPDLRGLAPKDYHLHGGERLNEAASRAWNQCQAAWKAFRKRYAELPGSDAGTSVTRDEWLLPLFQELGYGRLQTKTALKFEEKEYPVSHGWENHVPIHLLSARYPLDRRTPGVAGAATRSPYSLMQELLNRSAQHRWGFVANGLKLFVLRDNMALARAANVEFDLEAMMEGEVYADFMLLFLLCHQSRVEMPSDGKPEDCWLEKWSTQADQQGTRAREKLRDGVEATIKSLGAGFLTTKGNNALRDRLRSGDLATQDYYRQLLRLVYRLLMLLVAEEKKTESGDNLLHPPDATPEARERYTKFYSVGRIRTLAYERRGTAHTDLYESLKVLFLKLCEGYDPLGIPGMGSFLFSTTATPDLDDAALANQDLLDAFRHLCYTEDTSGRGGAIRRPVDFGNLGSEELGSVYESLLELHPQIDTDEGPFTLGTAAGHERKTTGSYYTPTSLINCLLDSALDPVVEDRLQEADRLAGGDWQTDEEKGKALRIVVGGDQEPPLRAGQKVEVTDARTDAMIAAEAQAKYETAAMKQWERVPQSTRYARLAEHALLDMKVCDPACGSGHFLIAAADRLAKHLARLRTGDDEPNTLDIQHAKRDIVGRCVYGVDLNPMAVELCKVSLWMEALEPGKPLSFLDHHIQCGNSLLGTTPKLLADGIPDDAFKPIEGDDKKVLAELKKDNKRQRKDYENRQGYLFSPLMKLGNLPQTLASINDASDESLHDVEAKRERYAQTISGADYRYAHLLADLWCSVFVWKKDRSDIGRLCPTERDFRAVEDHPRSINKAAEAEVTRLASQYQLFHWHLAFPDVFQLPGKSETATNEQCGWNGGFDVVVGNPPWERIKLQEKEWFAKRHPGIANARNAAQRRRMIAKLADEDPILHTAFLSDRRRAEGESHLVRDSGRYPLCGRGDVNTYTVFAETNRNLINHFGRVGCIVPAGVATDDTTKVFFQELVQSGSLVSLLGFENEEFLFPGVHHSTKFCLLTLSGEDRPQVEADFAFFARQVIDLADRHRRFTLSLDDLALLNPNTQTCPVFRWRRDAELNKAVYRHVPVLIAEGTESGSPWGIRFLRMLDMANDSHRFRTSEEMEASECVLEGNCYVERAEQASEATRESRRTRFLPLYEAKMFHHFDHRFSTYEGQTQAQANQGKLPELDGPSHTDPNRVVQPRYWVSVDDVAERLTGKWDYRWLLGWRDICRNTDQRTVIASLLPPMGVGHTAPLMLPDAKPVEIACLYGSLCSFVLDYVARQKVGGTHLTFGLLEQLPVLSTSIYAQTKSWSEHPNVCDWLILRVLELTYTAWDLKPLACDLGYEGAPFCWDEDRRFLLRCELDAAYFHLYLGTPAKWEADTPRLREMFPTPRDAVDYIMDTFTIVRRKDEQAHGEYRTKRVILEMYDQIAEAIRSGVAYQTQLDPPPGPPADADGNFIPVSQWNQSKWPSHIHPPQEKG